MKKYILNIVTSILIIFGINEVYGISNEFKFAIDTIGIPRYNSYNEEINEDIYYTYNVFVYSSPQKVKSNEQRWKNSKYGYWTKGGDSYHGTGTRGEYYILGTSYSGKVIYNYYFPMDVIPSTTPDKWTFYTYPGASASWTDKSKYKYTEQLEHMKTSKLMFNDIPSRAKADNPKYIKEYNITANKIGLSKARLDTAATWKTNGIISTRRKINGVIYSQVYLVKPMAASATVKTELEVGTDFVLNENQDEITIPIKYGVLVKNMTGYADKKHIKEITADVYVEDKKIDTASGSKITSVGNEYMLVITRDKYPPDQNHSVKITVDGYMHTEFAADGLMRDKISKKINVFVEPKLIFPVKETNVMMLEKDTLKWVVSPLAQTYITNAENSVGFIEGGKYLAIKLDLNVKETDIQDLKIYLDGIKLECEKMLVKEDSLILKIKLPIELNTTLYGIDSLRKASDSYFKVNLESIGTRKEKPHILMIKVARNGKEYSNEILLDTLDNYISNINSSIKERIINYKELQIKTNIEEYMNE